MTNYDLDSFKIYLHDYAENHLQHKPGNKKNRYICPFPECDGHGDFDIYDNTEKFYCYHCKKGGDLYDLVSVVEGLTPSEATRRVIELYGNGANTLPYPSKPTPAPVAALAAPVTHSFTGYIDQCCAALEGSPAQKYLEGRGLTLETMKRFKLGYDEKCYNNALRKQVPSIVIPYNRACTYYVTRPLTEKQYSKPSSQQAGTEPVFNAEALYNSPVVFVVESQLCAISIIQAGGTAIAIGGSGTSKVDKLLKDRPTEAVLIMCLDNDEAGRTATNNPHDDKDTNDLDAILTRHNVFHVNGTLTIMGAETDPSKPEYRKDPNEVLQKDGEAVLRAAIDEAVNGIKAAQAEAEGARAERTGEAMVDAFLADIDSENYKPMPTGLIDLDARLYGGFARKQLVILGAAPGAGKTALAQWIFEGMAAKGTASCIYLNLEMARTQILARTISRIAARNGVNISNAEVMQGYKWTPEQRAAVFKAAQEYRQTIAPRMIYNPDGLSTNLDAIMSYLEKEAQRAENALQSTPVVVVDYLQILTGNEREDAATLIKRAVASLKDYAIRHNTLVFAIIAHNRQSNTKGAVSMEAARDTSAIEYSADVQLALTFTNCIKSKENKTPKQPEELTEAEQHNITLRVVKGRFGGRGEDVKLYFDGATMTYLQYGRDLIPAPNTEVDQHSLPSKRY